MCARFGAVFLAAPLDQRPAIAFSTLPYLGLAPGWRFLIAPGYEDVWYDEKLLLV